MISKIEQKIDQTNRHWRKLRDIFLKPVIWFFVKVGVSANTISSFKIVLGFIYLLIIPHQIMIAMFLAFGGFIVDIFDGPVARYTKTDTDRGKFVDIITDQFFYAQIIFGLIVIEFSDILSLIVHLVLMLFLYLLVIVRKNENFVSDWLISPVARLSYYKVLMELLCLFKIFQIITNQTFSEALFGLNLIIGVHLMSTFFIFIRSKSVKK